MDEVNHYTTPRLVKGKKPTKIPKGSSLEKEWANNIWYINYSFNSKQIRVKGDLNRIKDHKIKMQTADALLQSIKNDLQKGFNPFQPDEFTAKIIQAHISIDDAVEKYLNELGDYARPKTIQSYHSKLRYLIESFPQKPLNSFTAQDLQNYIYGKIHSTKPAKINMNGKVVILKKSIQWTSNTVKSAKGIFRAFFQWSIQNKYYKGDNPVSKIESKKIRSEVAASPRNIPFTVIDNQEIMKYLDEKDKPTAFFCRFIYSTCLRPGELSQLKIKDVDIERKQIIVPLSTTKNTKGFREERIDIEENLYNMILDLHLKAYPDHYYLISNSDTIIGVKSMGKNAPYKRLKKALKALGLENKGYNLYSFKHFSNLQRFNSGWTLLEIMKANRHSSIAMTEKYLKHINRDTDISKKVVPKI